MKGTTAEQKKEGMHTISKTKSSILLLSFLLIFTAFIAVNIGGDRSPDPSEDTSPIGDPEPIDEGIPYTITGSGTSYTALRTTSDGTDVVLSGEPLQAVINAVRADAGGENCSITFGSGGGSYIMSSVSITFVNSDTEEWGSQIVFKGSIYMEGLFTAIKLDVDITLVLDGLIMKGDISLAGRNVTLLLSGMNDIDGSIVAPEGTALTIDSTASTADDPHSTDGSLKISGGADARGSAGIGGMFTGNKEDIRINGGNITINGGTVTATGGMYGAGIGGAMFGNGGNITINGGIVNTAGGNGGAGIGGGYGNALVVDTGNIMINGGTVTATGGMHGAGIGGGRGGTAGDITINGGTVTATGGGSAAGIGGGYYGNGGNITINNGTVNATNGYSGAAIGGGLDGTGGNITINDGTVNATTNGGGGAGIGGGLSISQPSGTGGNITINDGTVNATTNGGGGAGIGGGQSIITTSWTGGTIVINGGTVKASGGYGGGAGIGGGQNGAIPIGMGFTLLSGDVTINTTGSSIYGTYGVGSADITITGGTVTAIGGNSINGGAGIGGGGGGSTLGAISGTAGEIMITGGTVNAIGGATSGESNALGGAGIGGSSGTITICGEADVTARGGTATSKSTSSKYYGGSGIGGGVATTDTGTMSITIDGGTVNAYGGSSDSSVGIGGLGIGAIGTSLTVAITIENGTVTATGGNGDSIEDNAYKGAGIGAQNGTATINGGTVTAIGGINAAGIGGKGMMFTIGVEAEVYAYSDGIRPAIDTVVPISNTGYYVNAQLISGPMSFINDLNVYQSGTADIWILKKPSSLTTWKAFAFHLPGATTSLDHSVLMNDGDDLYAVVRNADSSPAIHSIRDSAAHDPYIDGALPVRLMYAYTITENDSDHGHIEWSYTGDAADWHKFPAEGYITVIEGETIFLRAAADDGYMFISWLGTLDSQTDILKEIINIDQDYEVSALFERDPLMALVTFDSKGGTAVAEQWVLIGGNVTKPVDPTKDTYLFAGWFTSLGDEWNFTADKVMKDMTLYADWSLDPLSWALVTFDSNGGTAVAEQWVLIGGYAEKPTNPTKDTYLFEGWFTDNSTFLNQWDFNDPVSGSMTLYADWSLDPLSWVLVTFESNGGTAVTEQWVLIGGYAEKPTNPTKDTYLFAGWFTSLGDEWNFTADKVMEDMTLYADWSLDPLSWVLVTFESNGGTAVAEQWVLIGGYAEKPTNPTKNTFIFAGWFTDDATFMIPWSFDDPVMYDMILYAEWGTVVPLKPDVDVDLPKTLLFLLPGLFLIIPLMRSLSLNAVVKGIVRCGNEVVKGAVIEYNISGGDVETTTTDEEGNFSIRTALGHEITITGVNNDGYGVDGKLPATAVVEKTTSVMDIRMQKR